MRFTVDRLDHLVLSCSDLELMASWYQRVLGMEREEVGASERAALKFGGQKIVLQSAGREEAPFSRGGAPGAVHICLVAAVNSEQVLDHLTQCGVEIVQRRSAASGALGALMSVICRDPDGNFIEIGSYLD